MIFKEKHPKVKMTDKTITSVLLGSYIRTMIISLFLGLLFFFVITGKEMVYRQNLNNSRILTTFSYFINMQLEDIKRYSYNLIIDEELQDIIDGKEEGKSKQISTFLMNKMAERNEIQSIHIVLGKDVISEYKQPVFDQEPGQFLKELGINPDNQEEKSSFYWEIGRDNIEIQRDHTFYLVGSIRSKTTLKHLGYLIVFLDPNELQKKINLYLQELDYEVLIKSGQGNTISFPSDSGIEKYGNLLVYREEADDSWWQLFHKKQYSSRKINSIQGEIYGMARVSLYAPNVEFALILLLIITIEFILIASVIIKRRVTSPLEEIARRARKIGIQGNLNILFPKEEYYSEADDISKALNEMMEQIRGLIQEVERREKLQKKLELSVINHQIKPHFLYNTLNAVSILISVEEKESANQLVKSVAKYYRACLNQGKDMISLNNELEIVEEYIKIALIRNPDILRVTYVIDPEAGDLQIPKMTIQTLVENSIKYGIKQMGEPIRITISAESKEGYAEITVEDNGSGIKKDIIERIMKGESLEAESGFGLRSVVMRISLSHDIKNISDIIRIESREGEFTKVILKVPFQNETGISKRDSH